MLPPFSGPKWPLKPKDGGTKLLQNGGISIQDHMMSQPTKFQSKYLTPRKTKKFKTHFTENWWQQTIFYHSQITFSCSYWQPTVNVWQPKSLPYVIFF